MQRTVIRVTGLARRWPLRIKAKPQELGRPVDSFTPGPGLSPARWMICEGAGAVRLNIWSCPMMRVVGAEWARRGCGAGLGLRVLQAGGVLAGLAELVEGVGGASEFCGELHAVGQGFVLIEHDTAEGGKGGLERGGVGGQPALFFKSAAYLTAALCEFSARGR